MNQGEKKRETKRLLDEGKDDWPNSILELLYSFWKFRERSISMVDKILMDDEDDKRMNDERE